MRHGQDDKLGISTEMVAAFVPRPTDFLEFVYLLSLNYLNHFPIDNPSWFPKCLPGW